MTQEEKSFNRKYLGKIKANCSPAAEPEEEGNNCYRYPSTVPKEELLKCYSMQLYCTKRGMVKIHTNKKSQIKGDDIYKFACCLKSFIQIKVKNMLC